jgi:hypothetical protein
MAFTIHTLLGAYPFYGDGEDFEVHSSGVLEVRDISGSSFIAAGSWVAVTPTGSRFGWDGLVPNPPIE